MPSLQARPCWGAQAVRAVALLNWYFALVEWRFLSRRPGATALSNDTAILFRTLWKFFQAETLSLFSWILSISNRFCALDKHGRQWTHTHTHKYQTENYKFKFKNFKLLSILLITFWFTDHTNSFAKNASWGFIDLVGLIRFAWLYSASLIIIFSRCSNTARSGTAALQCLSTAFGGYLRRSGVCLRFSSCHFEIHWVEFTAQNALF